METGKKRTGSQKKAELNLKNVKALPVKKENTNDAKTEPTDERPHDTQPQEAKQIKTTKRKT